MSDTEDLDEPSGERARANDAAISAADELVKTAGLLNRADLSAEVGHATHVLTRIKDSLGMVSRSSMGTANIELSPSAGFRSGLRAASAAIATLTGSGALSAAPSGSVPGASLSGEGTLVAVGVGGGSADTPVGLDEIYELINIMAKALIELPDKSGTPDLLQWIAVVIAFLTMLATIYPYLR